jgi:long-chain fatty acid transport protein
LRILRTRLLAWRPLAFTLIFIGLASKGHAQTNERLYENLNFRFVTPGARSIGMGKTFIGLADDATAAVSNPAGLSNLLEQEFSFEFSGTQRTERRTGSLGPGDVQQFANFTFTPTFFSYVLPLGRTSLAFFRNPIQNFHESFEFGPRSVPRREAPEDGAFGQLSSKVDNFGVSGAFVVNGSLSVGGSFNVTTLDLASEARSGTRLNPRNGTNTIDSGTRMSGTGGVLYKPGRGVSIGATYAQGVKFPLETELFGRFLYTVLDPDGTIILTGDRKTVDYVIPDRFGAGVSWRANRALTVLFDTLRIRYSQRITDRFLVVDFLDPAARLSPANFYVNDVYETHTGVEYRFYLSSTTMAVRGGMFTDPDHPLRFRSGGNNLDHPANALENFRFNTLPAQTTVGGTVGWGMAVNSRVQIDAAGSFSRDAKEFVASMVVRVR